MKIVESKVQELTAEEKSRCRSLSFRKDGDLAEWIAHHPTADVVRVFDGDLLVGWGMRTYAGRTGYYVRAKYRRQGIGAKIFYALNPPRTRPKVYPHDKGSAAFFYSLGQMKDTDVKRYGIDTKSVRRKPRHAVMAELQEK